MMRIRELKVSYTGAVGEPKVQNELILVCNGTEEEIELLQRRICGILSILLTEDIAITIKGPEGVES